MSNNHLNLMKPNELKERLDSLKGKGWSVAQVAREVYKKRNGDYPIEVEGKATPLYSSVYKAIEDPDSSNHKLVKDIVSVLGGAIPDPVWFESEKVRSSN